MQQPMGPGGGFFPREESCAQDLETGTSVKRFYSHKRRPDTGKLYIRRETNHIVWVAPGTPEEEIITSLSEIKEVRRGKGSKDFTSWKNEATSCPESFCFIALYGTDFKLKSLSIAAISEAEREKWITCLEYLRNKDRTATYITKLERFLRTEFYNMEKQRRKQGITLKEVKGFMLRIHYKIGTNELKKLFEAVDERRREVIGFDQFFELVKRITFEFQLKYLFPVNSPDNLLEKYSADRQTVTYQEFQDFLIREQGEPNEHLAYKIISDFVGDPSRSAAEPSLYLDEFLQYLFSKETDIWDKRHDKVNQDMSKPLSYYWISSSHNTYLTGDQLASESTVEAYARVLRQGSRCIELDCWDGPDGEPVITHGHTLTTKIQFRDVIKSIKENAFLTSEYPVILSIEDHCNIPQQQKMAKIFKEEFKDMLLTKPVRANETQMPSPEQLKRKIILKHKKLESGDSPENYAVNDDEFGGESEQQLSNSLKSGKLYQRNPVDQSEWEAHFFVLTQDRLYYSEDVQDNESENAENTMQQRSNTEGGAEQLTKEAWYLAKGGRATADDLLNSQCPPGRDGTFLVRRSENFVGDHTLSFWYRGKVQHCRIHTRQDGDSTRYWLKDPDSFNSIRELIEHYQQNHLRAQGVMTMLGEAISQPNTHERMEWYHADLKLDKAAEYLRRIPQDGAFLVRPSRNEPDGFAISFRAKGRIKHCRIHKEDNQFCIGSARFESLEDLVNYYKQNYLYQRVKLRYPVTEKVMHGLLDQEPVDGHVSGSSNNFYSSYVSNICVKAKYAYSANNSDELTVPKHAIIHNVNKPDETWWQGDYGGQRQYWFPATYVEEIESDSLEERKGEDNQLLGNLQKGSIDLEGTIISCLPVQGANRHKVCVVIKVTCQLPHHQVYELGCTSQSEAEEWIKIINQQASRFNSTSSSQQQRPIVTGKQNGTVAKELSDLVVYFATRPFDTELHLTQRKAKHNQVSSFPEAKMEKLIQQYRDPLFEFHKVSFSRVYPKAARVDSSNYNPMPMWNNGCQMVSLNFQTGDRPMQLNEGRFLQNGRSGYVLRPKDQWESDQILSEAPSADQLELTIKIFGARHLSKQGKGCISPMVEVEVIGSEFEKEIPYRGQIVDDNGLNPVFKDITIDFTVYRPECALLRFVVYDEDMFKEYNQIGQATYPVTCIKTGYRSVHLKNSFSEEIELASLLVHISKSSPGNKDQIHERHIEELHIMLQEAKLNNDTVTANRIYSKLEQLNARPSHMGNMRN